MNPSDIRATLDQCAPRLHPLDAKDYGCPMCPGSPDCRPSDNHSHRAQPCWGDPSRVPDIHETGRAIHFTSDATGVCWG